MLAALLSDRKEADEQLKVEIGQKTAPWGISVSSVEIRDVAIPEALQDAMSRQAQAEREKQARVILGSAEAAIAGKFVEAAAIYAGHPWALQLRAMNIIYETTKERGATILMPSSMVDSLNPSAATLALALAGNGALDEMNALGQATGGRPSPPRPRSQPRSQPDGQCACGADPRPSQSSGTRSLTLAERGPMLRNSKDLEGCAIGATDGAIGDVKDLYFDDEAWVIRYLVVTPALAFEPKGSDLTVRDQPAAMGAKATARLDHQRASQEQPRHRHRQAGLAPARNAVPQILPVSLLLGECQSVGCWRKPEALMPMGQGVRLVC